MKKNIISMAAAMAVLSACGPGVPQLGKSSLDEVIGAMTLEEKAHLVVGTGMAGFSGDSAVIGAAEIWCRVRQEPHTRLNASVFPLWCWLMVPPDCVSTPSVGGIRLRTIVLISLSELCSPLPGTRNWWKV